MSRKLYNLQIKWKVLSEVDDEGGYEVNVSSLGNLTCSENFNFFTRVANHFWVFRGKHFMTSPLNIVTSCTYDMGSLSLFLSLSLSFSLSLSLSNFLSL